MIFHSYVSLPEGILHGLLGIIITHIVETPINQGMGRDGTGYVYWLNYHAVSIGKGMEKPCVSLGK